MGLLNKENKTMCDQVEILYTRVVTMGDSGAIYLFISTFLFE